MSTGAYERSLLPLVAYDNGVFAYINEYQELISGTDHYISTPNHTPTPAPLIALLLDGLQCLVLEETGAVRLFDRAGPHLTTRCVVALPEPVIMLSSGWYGLYFFLGQSGRVYRIGHVYRTQPATYDVVRIPVPERVGWLGTSLTQAAFLTTTGVAYMYNGFTDGPAIDHGTVVTATAVSEGLNAIRLCAHSDRALVRFSVPAVAMDDNGVELMLKDVTVAAPMIGGRHVYAAAARRSIMEDVVFAVMRMDDGTTYHVIYETDDDGSVAQTVERLPAWSGDGAWSVTYGR